MVVPIKWFALVLALSPLAAMAQSTAPSGRHGDGHAENHDWYKDLKQPDIGSLARHLASLDARGTPASSARVPERPSYGPPSAASTDDGPGSAIT